MYHNGEVVTELWGIVNDIGAIVMSRGGSSTSPKIMVYQTESQAEKALNNRWTKQVHDVSKLKIKCIYRVRED